jgi:S1-C subfamily serine protease
VTASALIFLWATSCSQSGTPAGTNTRLMDSGQSVATVALINGRPSDYAGLPVQVDAVFKSREADGVLLIADPTGAEQTLAISDVPLGSLPALKIGDIVRVTGAVETFTLETSVHGPAFGDTGRPVSQDFYGTWNNRPAIIMTSIEKLAYPGQ